MMPRVSEKAPVYDRAILAKECQKRKSLLLE
jgi:hypothetical protein